MSLSKIINVYKTLHRQGVYVTITNDYTIQNSLHRQGVNVTVTYD